jgi:hypothetical protein
MISREYEMRNGMVLKTASAVQKWYPSHPDVLDEILFRTRRGQYWIEVQGDDEAHAEYMDARQAKRWINLNGLEMPKDLINI